LKPKIKIGAPKMLYNPLNLIERIEKTNILTNSIIVKSLQSNRGDKIRTLNGADLKMMRESVTCAVYNKLAVEAQIVYDFNFGDYYIKDGIASDKIAEFKLMSDVEIEEEVSAFFEINGKLQYREVKIKSFNALPRVDKSGKWLTQQMKWGVHGMQYDPFSLADRLEKADIETNYLIIYTLQCDPVNEIREMSYAEYKQLLKDLFSFHYRELTEEAKELFEQACHKYDAVRDGTANDPRKNFKPKTEFEIDQEIKAYFEELDELQ
jgi:hypothetical protein